MLVLSVTNINLHILHTNVPCLFLSEGNLKELLFSMESSLLFDDECNSVTVLSHLNFMPGSKGFSKMLITKQNSPSSECVANNNSIAIILHCE